MQREGSVVEHSGRKISHNRCGLDGEIAEHFVGAPSAEKADDIRVDLCAKQGHCAGGSQRAGGYIGRAKSKARAHSRTGDSQNICDIGWFNGLEGVLLCDVDSSQGGCWGCIVAPKVNDAARNAKSRGELGVATMGKPNDFASDTVLLRGERERSERGRQKGGFGSSCKV
jgi:hypothetical protein